MTLIGGQRREVRISLHPARLGAYNLSRLEVVTALIPTNRGQEYHSDSILGPLWKGYYLNGFSVKTLGAASMMSLVSLASSRHSLLERMLQTRVVPVSILSDIPGDQT